MSDDRRERENVMNALLEDILETNDEQILQEAVNDGLDVEGLISKARSIFEKSRYLIAKQELDSSRQQARNESFKPVDINTVRNKIRDAIEQNPDLKRQYTMAARSGEDLPDDDVLGLYEDLRELDMIEDD